MKPEPHHPQWPTNRAWSGQPTRFITMERQNKNLKSQEHHAKKFSLWIQNTDWNVHPFQWLLKLVPQFGVNGAGMNDWTMHMTNVTHTPAWDTTWCSTSCDEAATRPGTVNTKLVCVTATHLTWVCLARQRSSSFFKFNVNLHSRPVWCQDVTTQTTTWQVCFKHVTSEDLPLVQNESTKSTSVNKIIFLNINSPPVTTALSIREKATKNATQE